MNLGKIDAIPLLAVRDLERARGYYTEILGLTVSSGDQPQVLRGRSGSTEFLLYVSDYAGTNQANALVWSVGDRIEQIVSELRAKDVKFEHYDLPGMEIRGGIHTGGGLKLAWFKDPDGNILHLFGK